MQMRACVIALALCICAVLLSFKLFCAWSNDVSSCSHGPMSCQLCLKGFRAVGSNTAAHLTLAGVLSFRKCRQQKFLIKC